MTYRDLFFKVKDYLDDEVICADIGNDKVGPALLLFSEEESRIHTNFSLPLDYPYLVIA